MAYTAKKKKSSANTSKPEKSSSKPSWHRRNCSQFNK